MWGLISMAAPVLLLLCVLRASSSAQNVTVVLEKSAPINTNFSTFSRLLSMSNVSAEINGRSSLTILVPDNSVLDSYVGTHLQGMHLDSVGDFCRYHVLLQYLDIEEMMHMTNQTGLLVTTLYQTTGRAEGMDGFVNMTFGNDIRFSIPPPHPSAAPPPLTTVLSNFVRYPYNISFMLISKPLMPVKLAMKNRLGHYPSVTDALFRGGSYKTFQKLIQDTGVEAAIEDIEHQPFSPGVTVFAPNDNAFHKLPGGATTLLALSDAQRLSLVQYHVLASFFTFGSLRTQESPLSTLASTHEHNFVVNATTTRSAGLAIQTGVSSSNVIATLMEDDPVGVYALDSLLLPPEIFPLRNPPPATSPASQPSPAPTAAANPPSSSTPPATPPPPPSSDDDTPSPPAAGASASPPSPPSSSTPDNGSVANAPEAEAPLPDMSHAVAPSIAKFCVGVAAAAAFF